MKDFKFGEGYTVIPLVIQEGAVNLESNFIDVGGGHWVTFLLAFGDCDTAITVTVEAASAAATTSGETIGFYYRLSGAVSAGSDTWGAITSADSAGFSLTATTDTGKLTMIEVDPSTLPAGKNFVHVNTAATSYNSPTPAHVVIAVLDARYSQNVHPSST